MQLRLYIPLCVHCSFCCFTFATGTVLCFSAYSDDADGCKRCVLSSFKLLAQPLLSLPPPLIAHYTDCLLLLVQYLKSLASWLPSHATYFSFCLVGYSCSTTSIASDSHSSSSCCFFFFFSYLFACFSALLHACCSVCLLHSVQYLVDLASWLPLQTNQFVFCLTGITWALLSPVPFFFCLLLLLLLRLLPAGMF